MTQLPPAGSRWRDPRPIGGLSAVPRSPLVWQTPAVGAADGSPKHQPTGWQTPAVRAADGSPKHEVLSGLAVRPSALSAPLRRIADGPSPGPAARYFKIPGVGAATIFT